MAPPPKTGYTAVLHNLNKIKNYCKPYVKIKFLTSLLLDPARIPLVGVFILAVEVVLNLYVIENVAYTEIDWKAYMQECEGFINGTWDYSQLKGDTGPLVYPAGFVYVYTLLYYVTSHGVNVRLAQYIFLGLYLAHLCLVLDVHTRTSKVPPYALLITILTSYRVHSIFVLRLFNDTVAVTLFYASLCLFLRSRWSIASAVYSCAVAVKMNILLYAPALLLAYLANLGWLGTMQQLSICAAVQVLLAAPFLYTDWWSYARAAFDLQRVFDHQWTVNYRFLSPEIFSNAYFHISLLILHIALLILFMYKLRKYFSSYAALKELERQFVPQIAAENARTKSQRRRKRNKGAVQQPGDDAELGVKFERSSQLLVLPLWVAQLIGVACARSLHYQFYVWYFHSLPHLVFSTKYTKPVMFLLLALIELAWNTYPSTDYSSAMLHVCHAALLYGIYAKL